MEDRMPPSTNHSISKVVRDLRKQHGISQMELANVAGVSLPSVTRIEGGKATIRLDVLVKVLDALGYTLTIQQKVKA